MTCPASGDRTNGACLFFYDCQGYGRPLKPKPGDCCVFCSYGSVPCPPVQAARRRV
ncbi:MAG: GDCCVxC domain-containing (seleno)protein [Xanthobacteraceae bacterium]